MQDATLIGIDLGKHSFHAHGQDRQGKALRRKKFSRKQLIEAICQASANQAARTFGDCSCNALERTCGIVARASANKLARTAWAVAAHHTEFKRQEGVMVA